MPREMRFRVWDNHKKCWESRLCAITNTGNLMVYNPKTGEWFEPQHSGYKVSWSTGLKDKTRTKEYPEGQEIYEGDIVKWKNQIAKEEYQGSVWLVIWDEVHVKFTVKYKGGGKSSDSIFPLFAATSLEIIGNIHSEEKK